TTGESKPVLQEQCERLRIRMRRRRPKVLDVVPRHGMGVRTQGGRLLAVAHGCKGEWVDPQVVEIVFASRHRGEVVVDPAANVVDAELPTRSPVFDIGGIGDVELMFARLAGKKIRAPNAVEQVINLDLWIFGVSR